MTALPDNLSSTDSSIAASRAAAIRIFIFKSDKSVDLRAFADDLAGTRLPRQFSPWHAIGAIAPDQDPPYKFSRAAIEAAISGQGFQLWRLSKKMADKI